MLSICCISIKPQVWNDLVDNIHSPQLDYEIIFVGPEKLVKMPPNSRHIKTNVKVSQCNEIAIRNAQGEHITWLGDDGRFVTEDLNCLFLEYLELCQQENHNRVVCISNKRDGRRRADGKFSRAKASTAPIATLEASICSRELFDETGLVDKNYLATIWESDLAMRLHTIGVQFHRSTKVLLREITIPGIRRLHKTSNYHDIPILLNQWTRKYIPGEVVPSADTWGWMKDSDYVLSRKRLIPFEPFEDDNLLEYSQGVKEFRQLKWV
tara:strand:- start:1217 stop:2017 length:801 start_codon:yes stop_codon:yes gene_type:complete